MAIRTLFVMGTRPEAIKLAPVIGATAASPAFEPIVCATAQHRQLLDQVTELFRIRIDRDLDIMSEGQDLYDVTARALLGLRQVIRQSRPDIVIVQGDTTTCLAGALAAFYARVPVAHVEAGLRTYDLAAPFPEEANRAMTSRIARLHFAPTAGARDNLVREGIAQETILVTGNTVIDALIGVRDIVAKKTKAEILALLGEAGPRILGHQGPLILITTHRRENFGQGIDEVFSAIRDLAERHSDWLFVFPVHPNPAIKGIAGAAFGETHNILLIPPADYLSFVWLMNRARIILTDSGGVQEEAPSLGKPVLVFRSRTERPEGVDAGTVELVGTDRPRILARVTELMTNERAYRAMAGIANPYGDGKAAPRILRCLEETFSRISR